MTGVPGRGGLETDRQEEEGVLLGRMISQHEEKETETEAVPEGAPEAGQQLFASNAPHSFSSHPSPPTTASSDLKHLLQEACWSRLDGVRSSPPAPSTL